MNTLTLTSVNQLITLVKSNNRLVEVIPAMASLAALPTEESAKKPCNCAARKATAAAISENHKQMAEQILSSLTTDDFVKIKSVLNLDSLCYYRRNVELNKLEMICV